MLGAFYGWTNIMDNQKIAVPLPIIVSVIIAARDEDKKLPFLLHDLELQNYPQKLLEIIIIDDHSLKQIADLPEIKMRKLQNLTILDLDENSEGKKAALLEGVTKSSGELLIFTDADCRLKPGWIRSFVSKYLEEKAGMIIGLVDYPQNNGIFGKFFRFDLLSLVLTGSGLANIGLPTMCNGANLLVQSDLYKKHLKELKSEIASGDDIFMLHAIKKDRSEKISIIKDENSIVLTNPPCNIREFLSQRSRWASKSKYYRDRDTIILSVIVLFSNLILVFGFLNFLFTGNYSHIVFLCIVKFTADCLILASALSFFGGKRDIILLPFFSIIYPFYILIIAVRSFLKEDYWKGRFGFI